jgi:hypothetical protein
MCRRLWRRLVEREQFFNRLRELVKLTEEKRWLEARAKERGSRIAELESELLPVFGEHGLSSVQVDGYTVYLQRELYASPVDDEKLCDALAEVGYGSLVRRTVHRQQLSAWVREMDDDIPSTVRQWLQISEVFHLRVRRRP